MISPHFSKVNAYVKKALRLFSELEKKKKKLFFFFGFVFLWIILHMSFDCILLFFSLFNLKGEFQNKCIIKKDLFNFVSNINLEQQYQLMHLFKHFGNKVEKTIILQIWRNHNHIYYETGVKLKGYVLFTIAIWNYSIDLNLIYKIFKYYCEGNINETIGMLAAFEKWKCIENNEQKYKKKIKEKAIEYATGITTIHRLPFVERDKKTWITSQNMLALQK
ncbi:hypothetical protein RFI_23694 [Reticulomyxa filosa]|uniref:Uncharacterized protein n=1 Tax=Reticulomyxa filosa TaxID=46433 RepID=X6MKR9_RETFI|nr:hypothetical protein RFI_23694 [Reticulomyxa filosa]|eukprot:ETO13675.1 hypothetical protein RFI_23694 [Reticulomyxa filosa]